MKHKWKVKPAPTGRYRSFDKRGWPDAHYTDEEMTICAAIACEDAYYPSNVKTGDHAPLILRIADHSKTPWRWVSAKKRFATLSEAKEGLVKILSVHKHLMPELNSED